MTTKLTVDSLNTYLNSVIADAEKLIQGETSSRSYIEIKRILSPRWFQTTEIVSARKFISSKAFKEDKPNHKNLAETVQKADKIAKQLQDRYSPPTNYSAPAAAFFGCAWYFNLGTFAVLGTGAAIVGALYAIDVLNEREEKKRN